MILSIARYVCRKKGLVFALAAAIVFQASLSSATDLTQPADQTQQNIQFTGDHLKQSPVALNREYFEGYWADTKSIFTSPTRWDSSDWITASLVSGIAAGLYLNDDRIKDWVQRNKNTTTKDIVRNARRIGAATLPALGALYLYGYATDNDKAQETFLLSVESFAITGVFVQSLKLGTHRHRPYTGDPYNTWDGPSLSNEGGHLSFPSGDASSAFAVASVIASEYENYVLLPPLVYGAATVIALGRVHDNAHWATDVFVASAIGFFTGKALVHYHRGKKESKLSIAPLIDGKDMGLMLTYRY
jgi:membrane-associated phospholipid phosphatase